MNVFFIDYYKPEDNNGICAYRKLLTKFLSQQKEINLVVVYTLSTKSDQIRVEQCDGFKEVYLPFDLVANGKIAAEDIEAIDFLKTLEDVAGDATVFHLNWMNHSYLTPLIHRKFHGVKTVLTKHCVSWREYVVRNLPLYLDIEAMVRGEVADNMSVRRILRDENTFFNLVDHVITVTDDAKDIVGKLYKVDDNKITRVRNGIHIQSAQSAAVNRLSLRRKYGFKDADKIILFVGGLFVFKGLHTILPVVSEIMEEDEDVKLVVCGSGQFQGVMSMLPKSISGKTIFLGNKNKDDLYEIYGIADIGIVPSLEEQCSYVALEMMSSGLPLVVSDVPGLREVLPEDSGMYIPMVCTDARMSADVAQAKKIITNLLYDEVFTTKYVEKLQRYLREHFDQRTMCEQTLAVYHKALNACDIMDIGRFDALISVVIPCYNAEETIADAINSVLMQKGVNYEIIIVDDGSTDRSRDVVRSFSDANIKLVENKENKGVAEALNVGISAARGKYIARLDADDIMLPGRLYKQVQFLENNKDYDIVGGNMFIVDRYLHPFKAISYPETDDEIRRMSFFMNPFAHPTMMMRKTVFDNEKYDNAFLHCEDYSLWLRLLRNHKAYNLQDFLTGYRYSDQSVSAKHAKVQNQSALSLKMNAIEALISPVGLNDRDQKNLAAMTFGAPKSYWDKHQHSFHELVKRVIEAAGLTVSDAEVRMQLEAVKLLRM